MTQDTRKLGPTLTLARLYESQQQFLDALAIYRRLHQERGSEEAAEKIAELEERILSEKSLAYDTIITTIFTREELKRFKVLPHDRYTAWRKSMVESEDEEKQPEADVAAQTVEPEPQPLATPQSAAEVEVDEQVPMEQPAVIEITLGQLIEKLRSLGDDDTRLGDIALGELLALLCRGGR
ncbi:MAG: hypothetical protein K8R90_04930 [Candidatus Cloacimonetes bacterium]|nr:hypothetical protein [Candidatus Cloacimonadota bacterium]